MKQMGKGASQWCGSRWAHNNKQTNNTANKKREKQSEISGKLNTSPTRTLYSTFLVAAPNAFGLVSSRLGFMMAIPLYSINFRQCHHMLVSVCINAAMVDDEANGERHFVQTFSRRDRYGYTKTREHIFSAFSSSISFARTPFPLHLLWMWECVVRSTLTYINGTVYLTHKCDCTSILE